MFVLLTVKSADGVNYVERPVFEVTHNESNGMLDTLPADSLTL